MQSFYDMARNALKAAEAGVGAADSAQRVRVVLAEAPVDPELKSLMR
jgi:hypothetical protein